jgi:hypothetical protein
MNFGTEMIETDEIALDMKIGYYTNVCFRLFKPETKIILGGNFY